VSFRVIIIAGNGTNHWSNVPVKIGGVLDLNHCKKGYWSKNLVNFLAQNVNRFLNNGYYRQILFPIATSMVQTMVK